MREKLVIWLVWKLPRTVVYWCAVRLIAHATQGRYSKRLVTRLTAMDALKRWNENDAVMWNPYNKVVQDHRDGTIHDAATDAERKLRGLETPWTPEMANTEVRQAPIF